jgi:hypothetical protein
MTAAVTAMSGNLAEQSRNEHESGADYRTNYVNLADYRKLQLDSAPCEGSASMKFE